LFWKFRIHQGYYSNIAYSRNRQGCNYYAGFRLKEVSGVRCQAKKGFRCQVSGVRKDAVTISLLIEKMSVHRRVDKKLIAGSREIRKACFGFSFQMSDYRFLFPAICLPSVAFRAKGGHLKPKLDLETEKKNGFKRS